MACVLAYLALLYAHPAAPKTRPLQRKKFTIGDSMREQDLEEQADKQKIKMLATFSSARRSAPVTTLAPPL